MSTIKVGSISTDTLHPADLYEAFTRTLYVFDPALSRETMNGPLESFDAKVRSAERSDDLWFTDEACEALETLTDALDGIAPDGLYFGTHPGDGADYGFWETEEAAEDREWAEFLVKVEAGSRKIHVAGEEQATTFFLFNFGAYGDFRIAVGVGPGLTSLEDALEVAAETLLEVAPGVFIQPDYDDVRNELGQGATDEAVMELAETDLTYTESGFLASWEWTVSEKLTREELLAIATG